MNEIRMWKWEYTDATGERKVTRWLMTEKEACRYKDAVPLEHTLQVRFDRPPAPGTRGPSGVG